MFLTDLWNGVKNIARSIANWFRGVSTKYRLPAKADQVASVASKITNPLLRGWRFLITSVILPAKAFWVVCAAWLAAALWRDSRRTKITPPPPPAPPTGVGAVRPSHPGTSPSAVVTEEPVLVPA